MTAWPENVAPFTVYCLGQSSRLCGTPLFISTIILSMPLGTKYSLGKMGFVITNALPIGPRFNSSLSLGSIDSLTCFWIARRPARDWLLALPSSVASDLGVAYLSFLSTF